MAFGNRRQPDWNYVFLPRRRSQTSGGGHGFYRHHGVSGRVRISRAQTAIFIVEAAIINMTRALALDLGRLGVRVNGIAPGPIDTAMQSHKSSGMRQGSIERTALGRSGSPD